MNICIQKRVNIYKWFVRIFECYSVKWILDEQKMGKFRILYCVLFPQNMILNKAIRYIWYANRKVKRSDLGSMDFKCVMDAFYTLKLIESMKKNLSWPRNNWKSTFLFYFWVENMSNHTGLFLCSSDRLAVWLGDIA